MFDHIVHRAEFEQLLAAPVRWRSAHFALHHVSTANSAARVIAASARAVDLSTSISPMGTETVDNSPGPMALGVVVPKRHARRAVTRNLIRRLARAVFALHAPRLPSGRWLVRLKSPFSPREFVSASSPALAAAVRNELDGLLSMVGRQPARGAA